MDLLLRKKYTYNFPGSFDQAIETLRAICSDRSAYFSTALSGTIDEDGSFSLKTYNSFFTVVSIGQTIYLRGKIIPSAEGAIVNIMLSPNIVLPFVVYLLPLVSLNVLFGDNSLMGADNGRLNNFMVIVALEIVIFLIIQIASFFIRRKFEKAVNLPSPFHR